MCQISPSKSIWSLELIDHLTMRPTRRSPRAKEILCGFANCAFAGLQGLVTRGSLPCQRSKDVERAVVKRHREVLVMKMYHEGVVHAKSNQADDLDFRSLRIKTTRRLIKIRVSCDSSDRAPEDCPGSVSGSPQEEISAYLPSPLCTMCPVRSLLLVMMMKGRSVRVDHATGGFNDCHRVVTGNVSDRGGSDLAEDLVVRVKRVTMMMTQDMTFISAEAEDEPCTPRSPGFTSRSSGYAVDPSGRAECSKFEVD